MIKFKGQKRKKKDSQTEGERVLYVYKRLSSIPSRSRSRTNERKEAKKKGKFQWLCIDESRELLGRIGAEVLGRKKEREREAKEINIVYIWHVTFYGLDTASAAGVQ